MKIYKRSYDETVIDVTGHNQAIRLFMFPTVFLFVVLLLCTWPLVRIHGIKMEQKFVVYDKVDFPINE